MKLRSKDSHRTARAFILPFALVALGLTHSHPEAAQTQLIDTTGQSFYVNVRPLMDYPLRDLLKAVPELRGLKPARNHGELASILDKTGKVTEELMESMPNLISREEVTQEKLGALGRVKEHRRLDFDYMILVHRQGTTITLDEYRPRPDGSPLEEHGLEEGYMLTRGFASLWMHFLPPVQSASRFRFLGQQINGGVRCYVVAFAQKPGWATITGTFFSGRRSVCLLYQGIAWIDEVSFRIVRLRTDLLAPRPDIGLERQTTELHLGEARLPQTVSPLWLPQEVVVTTDLDKRHFRNVHRYSGYREFKVESKILSAPPDQTQPKAPN